MILPFIDVLLIAIQQSPVDSLANAIGTDIGVFAGAWALVGLGAVVKFGTTAALKVLERFGTLPDTAKAGIALVFSVAITFVSQTWNIPFVSTDINDLPVIFSSVSIWGLSMGWHGFVKTLLERYSPKAATPTE